MSRNVRTQRGGWILDVAPPALIALCFYCILLAQLLSPLGFNASGLIRIGDRFDGRRFWTPTTIVNKGNGYDGQFFFYLANDPALRTPDPEAYLDLPAYRYARILYPFLAWLLALGQPFAIPWTMLALNVMAAVAGTVASAIVLRSLQRRTWGALLFAYCPAVLLGVMGGLAEPTALALLAVGFALYLHGRHRQAGVTLGLAALARETSALISIGFVLDACRRRIWGQAAHYAVPLVIPLAWHLWVWHRLGALPAAQGPANFGPPFGGPLYRAGVLLGTRATIVDEAPASFPWPELGFVAISALIIIAGLLWIFRRRDVFTIQFWLQAILAVWTTPLVWVGIPSYGRVLGPLYLTFGLVLASTGRTKAAADAPA
jgi:hypothetical protein